MGQDKALSGHAQAQGTKSCEHASVQDKIGKTCQRFHMTKVNSILILRRIMFRWQGELLPLSGATTA